MCIRDRILSIERHPDADKLIICQVNVGAETVQIVTGAPNVKAGDKVPVVLDGGRVAGGHDGKKTPGGIKIKNGKLRGVESFGMMCSIEAVSYTHLDVYKRQSLNCGLRTVWTRLNHRLTLSSGS